MSVPSRSKRTAWSPKERVSQYVRPTLLVLMTTVPAPRRTPRPTAPRSGVGEGQVAVVVANFNTRRLIAQLIFFAVATARRDQFTELVVVDNASTDGSRQLLAALERAGLLRLIANRVQRYHGPALTQGISWLARRQKSDAGPRVDYVWVLDSDVVVLRHDAVRNAVAVFDRSDAAAVGQTAGDPAYDRLLRHNTEMLHPVSLMLDPRRLWRRPIPPSPLTRGPAPRPLPVRRGRLPAAPRWRHAA